MRWHFFVIAGCVGFTLYAVGAYYSAKERAANARDELARLRRLHRQEA